MKKVIIFYRQIVGGSYNMQKAFTLIEVLVVVLIIGVLAAVYTPSSPYYDPGATGDIGTHRYLIGYTESGWPVYGSGDVSGNDYSAYYSGTLYDMDGHQWHGTTEETMIDYDASGQHVYWG